MVVRDQTLKVYIYPDHNFPPMKDDPRFTLLRDQRISGLAIFQGSIIDGFVPDVHVYKILFSNLKRFEDVCRSHSCTEVYL